MGKADLKPQEGVGGIFGAEFPWGKGILRTPLTTSLRKGAGLLGSAGWGGHRRGRVGGARGTRAVEGQ